MALVNVLDLFSGLEGWATVFLDRGHNVVTLDLDPKFGADYQRDILTVGGLQTLADDGTFDVICASPPCEAFSTGSIGRHWGGGVGAYEPKTEKARVSLEIVKHTFDLIDRYQKFHNRRLLYVIENPGGVMRKIAPRPPTGTTWYCQWGESRAKPTDLWTNMTLFPPGEWPSCHNGNPDHDQQSRYYWKWQELGQTGGTQGLKDAATRALIPIKLATAFAEWAEAHQ